uniref:Uncharacterized protein n=1 Tax=Leptocylindrus danicus TaxID=163516 RepID=A0A7S2PCS9_9STRA|mmetsp:Transcript_29/g.48  ORF Transcript_29/g.48 Transcript_29/m.48 type:complete len:234 (+) Transcript_29:825-1526(+)|eukprot:CAMPEP_0116013336 /NCGR_PEP_ID=MMETSP0321-20121206/5669_1 /TAXON_ID=163516 /ORGANISM="Leptocylindrus danicus var. danicus, Strain B650" /LENGTH=233 /DNA_ID=CAMNT_0003482873 /DNA_START=718 /DNA_END=1419 /DNA_ORIENTATION=-
MNVVGEKVAIVSLYVKRVTSLARSLALKDNQIIIVVPESVAVNFTFVEENVGKKLRKNVEVVFLSSSAPGQQQQKSDRVDGIRKAIEGCTQLYMITKCWTKFIHPAEESLAVDLLKAAVSIVTRKADHDVVQIALPQNIMMCTFEDTQRRLDVGLASELPNLAAEDEEGPSSPLPTFEGMKAFLDLARISSDSVSIVHVLMAVMRQGAARKGLCAIFDYETLQLFPHLEPAPP